MLQIYGGCESEEITKKYFEENHKLNEILIHEELYWKTESQNFLATRRGLQFEIFSRICNHEEKVESRC